MRRGSEPLMKVVQQHEGSVSSPSRRERRGTRLGGIGGGSYKVRWRLVVPRGRCGVFCFSSHEALYGLSCLVEAS